MGATNAIFYIAILIMSVVIHEVSHGFMAEYFGDKTARLAGRLTLNPIKHLDLFGSIILPAFLVLTQSPFLIGWAKPVPYNPYNLTNRRKGELAVASAGVLANFFIAILFGLILRFSVGSNVPAGFDFIMTSIVLVNIGLGIFNLVPIPPLDGSKIFYNLLPVSIHRVLEPLERFSLVFIVIFIVFFSNYLYPVLTFLFKLITGLSL
jgi:Zn-dependent protease